MLWAGQEQLLGAQEPAGPSNPSVLSQTRCACDSEQSLAGGHLVNCLGDQWSAAGPPPPPKKKTTPPKKNKQKKRNEPQ